MPRYFVKVMASNLQLPTDGWIKFGNTTTLNAASIASIATISGKLTATKATSIAAVATADATDLATALVLVNALKAKVNELIAGQKSAGQML